MHHSSGHNRVSVVINYCNDVPIGLVIARPIFVGLCALTKSNPPLLEDDLMRPYLAKFPEPLVRIKPNSNNGWSCDSKEIEAYKDLVPNGLCQMQISKFHQTKYIQGYCLKKNGYDFDICIGCLMFLETNL